MKTVRDLKIGGLKGPLISQRSLEEGPHSCFLEENLSLENFSLFNFEKPGIEPLNLQEYLVGF